MSDPVLFYNGVIHTLDPVRPHCTWFTVLGKSIQHIGDGEAPQTKTTIDLKGKVVVPGFVDAHTHFFQTGLDKLFCDFSSVKNIDDVHTLVSKSEQGKRTWIFAHSYDEENLSDGRPFTSTQLDLACPQKPLWVNRVDYHSAVVNSVALKRLNIPIGIQGLMRDKDGNPTGVLRSEVYFYAKAKIASIYPLEIKNRAVNEAAKTCICHGVTAVHALEGGRIFGDEGVMPILKKMERLPLDLTLFLQEKNLVYATKLGFRHLGGCILIDGSIGSYTAALDQDYQNAKGVRGHIYEKPREFFAFVEGAHCAGVQLSFHAIGPRAIQLVLDAYDSALRKYPRYDHRHRIEHFELATDEQIHRARDLGVVASMQPNFEYFWGGPEKMYQKRLGDGWKSTNRFADILKHGLTIAGGSDTNVTPPDPILGIHAAVNHPNEDQKISVDAALRMMTINAAYAGFNETKMGTISPGKNAAFTVLDKDFFTVNPSEIKNIKVVETWFSGRCVYRSDSNLIEEVQNGYDS